MPAFPMVFMRFGLSTGAPAAGWRGNGARKHTRVKGARCASCGGMAFMRFGLSVGGAGGVFPQGGPGSYRFFKATGKRATGGTAGGRAGRGFAANRSYKVPVDLALSSYKVPVDSGEPVPTKCPWITASLHRLAHRLGSYKVHVDFVGGGDKVPVDRFRTPSAFSPRTRAAAPAAGCGTASCPFHGDRSGRFGIARGPAATSG